MADHTPGPWAVADRDDEYDCHTIYADSGTAWSICTTHSGLPEGHERANARLIAAAPELLKACKQILDAVNHPDLDGRGAYVDSSRASDAAFAAKRAIDKATGDE